MDNRDIVRLRKDETARLNPERATIITVAWNNARLKENYFDLEKVQNKDQVILSC
jgi:hypothetical protein